MPQLPKPASPHIIGSTTPCTSAQAIAASTALPPALRMSAPASVASGCAATIIAPLRYRMRVLSGLGRSRAIRRQPAIDSIVSTSSAESASAALARSWVMCSRSEVPVSGSIPTASAKRNTTCAGVARSRAAMRAISG